MCRNDQRPTLDNGIPYPTVYGILVDGETIEEASAEAKQKIAKHVDWMKHFGDYYNVSFFHIIEVL
jgi:predicted RNase H-like HicB family nuclease